jgi:hypothetical protein
MNIVPAWTAVESGVESGLEEGTWALATPVLAITQATATARQDSWRRVTL